MMLPIGKSILLSRTVWTATAGAVVAILQVSGYPVADEQVSHIIDLGLFVMAGIFRVMATQPVHVVAPK